MNERTQEILNRFSLSWTETELFYDDLIHNHEFYFLKPVRNLISHLRSIGYDKFFRIGTSVHFLLISRSVNHGLRDDQKNIRIEAFGNGTFQILFRDGNKVYREYILDNLEDVRVISLLRTLKSTLID